VNESELTAAFEQTRASAVAPPHGLTPRAMIAAGQRARRRRRVGAVAGAGLAALVALTIGVGVVNAATSGPGRPVVPGQPTPASTPTLAPSPVPVSPTVAPTPGETPSVTPGRPV